MSGAPDPVATRIRGSAPNEDGPEPPLAIRVRRRTGAIMSVLSFLAFAVAGYLTWVKLSGGMPACAIVSGCETVEKSSYSEMMGIPVALFGMLGAGAMLAGSLLWWLRADRRALMVAYGVGLVSLPVLAWLTYLELAVIHAICIWCVTFAVLLIGAWVVALLALRDRAERDS